MNNDQEALISNEELEKMVKSIRDKTSRDSAFELLVLVRGTYEIERAKLYGKLAAPAVANVPSEVRDYLIEICTSELVGINDMIRYRHIRPSDTQMDVCKAALAWLRQQGGNDE